MQIGANRDSPLQRVDGLELDQTGIQSESGETPSRLPYSTVIVDVNIPRC